MSLSKDASDPALIRLLSQPQAISKPLLLRASQKAESYCFLTLPQYNQQNIHLLLTRPNSELKSYVRVHLIDRTAIIY